MSANLDTAARTIVNLVLDKDPRSEGMMQGWAIELARQKLLFLSTPAEFRGRCAAVAAALDEAYDSGDLALRTRCVAFMLGIAESLNSVVELHHNLQKSELHESILSDADAKTCRDKATELVLAWEKAEPKAAEMVLDCIKTEDMAVNKGDNLFVAWAIDWQAQHDNPYGCISEYLKCFSTLYGEDTYYVKLFLAWEEEETRTQFFNDYGMQAARCRRLGSLGGTTNPAIAVMGEDDLDGKGNIHGDQAIEFIKKSPNKWTEIRKVIAREQIEKGMPDDWGAVKFTEWVVVDAMLGLRSVFHLAGLGRVAFQLRPDWHCDEKKLTYAGGEVYEQLCKRVKIFDDILLHGVGAPYTERVASRVGKSNNHFKIACTGQAALNVVKAFNAGRHPEYPDAVKERMYTNMTLSYEVPQMLATYIAVEEGIADWEQRTGQKANDGKGGSVITSMIGRFNDAIRVYRIEQLLAALPADSKFRTEIKPAAIKLLTDAPINTPEFIAEVKAAGIDFNQVDEEDAIDRAGTLATKRVVIYIERKYRTLRNRILTASKRNFYQNTELLDVPF